MRQLPLLLALLALSTPLWAASSLEVVLPNQSTTSVSFNFTVTARNGAAVDTAYVGTVHFTSSDPGATLPADYTFTLADAGTHMFNATMANSGPDTSTANHTITATDNVTASINGADVTTVKWAPDVVRALRIELPELVTRTVSFQGTVSALNADHQVVTGYTGTVHFTTVHVNDVALPPDYTFMPADNGVHSFTFTVSTGGNHGIGVADVGNPAVSGHDSFYVNCPELTASASNTGPVCANGAAILMGSSNQSDVQYYWQGGYKGWWYSSDQNPTAPGPYDYHLTVTNSVGCQAFASTTVGKLEPPPIPLAPPSSSFVCGGQTVSFSVANPDGFTDFDWHIQGGTILSGQGTTSIQVQTDNTDYQTTADVDATHTATGCEATSAYQRVEVDPVYSADITVQSSACPNATVTATRTPHHHGGGWSATNATVISDGGPTLVFQPNGSGDVMITSTVWNQWSTCNDIDTKVVSITGPSASLDAELGVCPGQSTAFPVTLSGTAPFTITWSDGFVQSGVTTTTTSRTVAPTQTTIYTITSVTDALCTGSANGSATVVVQSDPEILDEPQNVTIQKGETATLSVEASGTDLRYDWYEGDSGDRSQFITSGPSPTFTTPPLEHTTRYWVAVTSDCGLSESKSARVIVSGRPAEISPEMK